MIKKILFIPRAVIDLTKVLLNNNLPFKKRLEIVKSLIKIKFAGLTKKLNQLYQFNIGKYQIDCYFNNYNIFLVKEIFVDQIYKIEKSFKINSILDLGSNIGLSIIYFKMQHSNAMLHAFEPDKLSFELLKKNITQNKIEQVFLNESAITNESGFLYAAQIVEKASVNSHFVKDGNDEKRRVVSISIEEVLKTSFDIIKIDIEGGEWDVFRKIIDKKLITKANHWFVEFHNKEDKNIQFEEILNCFEQNGYGLEQRNEVIYFYKNDKS